jgi:rRNA-processing protein FCF1
LTKLQVIADTSFLMIPGLFGVDIIGELDRLLEKRYNLVIPGPVINELEELVSRGRPIERSAARLGLSLAARGKKVEIEGPADGAIVNLARENFVVGTTDSALRKEIRRRRVPVIYLREKSHLAVDGQIE